MPHQVRMPALSQSMLQGRVIEWLKKEGDRVDKGEPLVVVESDKAANELESPHGGILTKILVDVGADVDVDSPLALIADPDEQIAEPPSGPPKSAQPAPPSTPAASIQPDAGRKRPVTPVAKRLARELGVDVALVPGTGDNGMVTEKDVRTYAGQAAPPVPPDEQDVQVISLTGLRGRIAERMSLSRRTAADVTTIVDVDMGAVASRRQVTGHSYTAYVAEAAAQSLREFPLLNAWLIDDRIHVRGEIHLGVAVAIQGALVVPVLRNAGDKSVGEIDKGIDALAVKARAGQLTPDDMKGSTFTVTNSGAFGSLLFTPIINIPEVAILGMGKVADTPVVRQGQVVAGKLMYLCLSYDHRAVDGAVAVQFLQAVKRRLEEPE